MASSSLRPFRLVSFFLSWKRRNGADTDTPVIYTCRSFPRNRLSFILSITFLIHSLSIPVNCYRLSIPSTVTAGVPVIATWFRDTNDPNTFGILENNLMINSVISVIPITESSSSGTVTINLNSPGQFALPAASETTLSKGQIPHEFAGGPQIAVLANAGRQQPPITSSPTSTLTPIITYSLSSESASSPAPLKGSSAATDTNTFSTVTVLVVESPTASPVVGSDNQSNNDSKGVDSTVQPPRSSQTSLVTTSISDGTITSTSAGDATSSSIASSPTFLTSGQVSNTITTTLPSEPGSGSPNPSPSQGITGSQDPHHNSKEWRERIAIILGVISAVFVAGVLFRIFVIEKQRYANKRRIQLFKQKLKGMGMGWMVAANGSSYRESGSTDRSLPSTRPRESGQSRSSSWPWGTSRNDANHQDTDEDRRDTATIRSTLSNYSLGFGSFASHMRERDERLTQIYTQYRAVGMTNSEEALAVGTESNHSVMDRTWRKSLSPGTSLNISRLSPPESAYYPFAGTGSTSRSYIGDSGEHGSQAHETV